MKWIPCSCKFVVVGVSPKNEGVIQVHELTLNIKEIEPVKWTTEHGISCATLGAAPTLSSKHLAYGDSQGNIRIVDLNQGVTGSLLEVKKAHKGIINAMDGIGSQNGGGGPHELVTGGRDGCAKIWDVRVANGKPVCSLEPKTQNPRDCWTVAFGNSCTSTDRQVAAGFDNGDLKLFDLRSCKMVWETNVGNGVTSIQYDRPDILGNKLLVTSLESKFRIYSLRTQVSLQPLCSFCLGSFAHHIHFIFIHLSTLKKVSNVQWNEPTKVQFGWVVICPKIEISLSLVVEMVD